MPLNTPIMYITSFLITNNTSTVKRCSRAVGKRINSKRVFIPYRMGARGSVLRGSEQVKDSTEKLLTDFATGLMTGLGRMGYPRHGAGDTSHVHVGYGAAIPVLSPCDAL